MKSTAIAAFLLGTAVTASPTSPPQALVSVIKSLPPRHNSTHVKVTTGMVGTSLELCTSLSEFVPDFCQCVDNAAGAKITCTVDLQGYDTVQMTMDMDVCAEPASVSFDLIDANGIEFQESFASGDSGTAETGIMIGLPKFGDAEILLAYSLAGDIEALEMQFGFDLGVTVLGYQQTCGGYFPDKCPVMFLDTTLELEEGVCGR